MRVSRISAFIVIFSVVFLIYLTSGLKHWTDWRESACKWKKNNEHNHSECKRRCENKWGWPRNDEDQAPFATGRCWSKKCVCKLSEEYKGYVKGYKKKIPCFRDKFCRSMFQKLQNHFKTHPDITIKRKTP